MEDNPAEKIRELEKRLKRLQDEKEVLNRGIDIADSTLGTDIRKKYLGSWVMQLQTTWNAQIQMAIKNREAKSQELIHHSDRGLQYCSNEYFTIAKNDNIQIGMTENGDPYENALAEGMNRTLKEEFGLGQILATKAHAKTLVEQAVNIYKNYRPHLSLKMQTPNSIHKR